MDQQEDPGSAESGTLESPTYSIVIPTHARPRSLAIALDGITRLDWPMDDYEVIVIDDGSPAGNESVAQEFSGRLNLRLIRQARQGPAGARNTGAEHAQGRFLAFLDDDCVPDPDWLRALHRAFASDPQALMGGNTRNALADNSCSAAAHQISVFLCHHQTGVTGEPKFFTSNNIALSAAVFARVGGFNRAFSRPAGEDRDFCRRLARCGYRLRFVPDAMVLHAHALSLRGFWRQNFNYGRGAAVFHRLGGERQRPARLPEPLQFYIKLITSPLRSECGLRAWLQVGLLCLSQVAVATGFTWERALAPGARRG
ncbi:MAG: glycosyltransferase [Chromatiales bacterium]|nr:MAG: glycosyltransferase [Chromatiales bacterium]